MNSIMMKENCTKYFKGLDKPTARKLLQHAAHYTEASKAGDPTKFHGAYQLLLTAVHDGERATGIQLIKSSDGSFLCALNAVAAFFQTVINTVNTISFDSLQQANAWLTDKSNLIITDVKIETRTTLGLFANHSNASKISISYRAGAGEKLYQYGICQQEKTNLFIHRKEKAFAKNWEEAHPGMECISLQHTCNSRGSTSSLLFGFGLDYVEHVKYFITYRKPISVA